jgi:hypothetical protein
VDDGNLKRLYLNKYVNRNYKNNNTTALAIPIRCKNEDIGPTELQIEEIENKTQIEKNGITIYLLKHC